MSEQMSNEFSAKIRDVSIRIAVKTAGLRLISSTRRASQSAVHTPKCQLTLLQSLSAERTCIGQYHETWLDRTTAFACFFLCPI